MNNLLWKRGVTLNNFMIAEKEAWSQINMTNIEISFSARNMTEVKHHFVVMLAGWIVHPCLDCSH